MNECALWYDRHHNRYVEFCRDEAEAVESAMSWSDAGEASIVGVQLADGTTYDRDHWPAYEAAWRRSMDEFREQMAADEDRPPPRRRTFRGPFGTVDIIGDEAVPDWFEDSSV